MKPKLFPIHNKMKFSIYGLILLVILTTFLSLTLFFSLYTPAFEGPDEEDHYGLSKLISEGGNVTNYAKIQPLYYSINGFLLYFIDHPKNIEITVNGNFDRSFQINRFIHGNDEVFPFSGTSKAVHTLRILSVIFGFITLVFTYKLSQIIFSSNRWLPLFVIGIVAFIPKFLSINSVLNEDVLVWSLSTISFYLLLKFTSTKNRGILILLGIFAGLSILSKLNGVIVVPVVIVAFVFMYGTKQIKNKEFFKYLSLFLISFLVSGGAYSIYQNIQIHSYTLTTTPLSTVTSLWCITNFDVLFFRMFATIWGYIGWQVIDPTKFQLSISGILLTLIISGLFLIFVRKISLTNIRLENNHIVILFSSTIFMLIAMLYYLWQTCVGDIRYTFPVISIFGVLSSLGLYVFFDKKNLRFLMISPMIFLVYLNVSILIQADALYDHGAYVLLPSTIRYASSSQLQSFTPASNAFDSNPDTVWHSNGGMPQWIEVDYRKPIVKNHVEIISGNLWHPKDFEIQAFNDPLHIITLKKIRGESNWSPKSSHDYSFVNSDKFRFYRINVEQGQGNAFVEFAEIHFS